MSKFKTLIPETLFLAGSFVYWFFEGALYNPLAIVITLIFLQQIIFKNAFLGILIGGFTALICTYIFFAALSELSEFNSFSPQAQQLLLGSLLLLLPALINASLMLRNYIQAFKGPEPSKHRLSDSKADFS